MLLALVATYRSEGQKMAKTEPICLQLGRNTHRGTPNKHAKFGPCGFIVAGEITIFLEKNTNVCVKMM